jgi:hypothetical protein
MLPAAISVAQEVLVVDSDGGEYEGRLVSLDKVSLQLEIGDEVRSLPTATVTLVRRRAAQPASEDLACAVSLVHGTELRCDAVTLSGGSLTLSGGIGHGAAVSRESVRSLRMMAASGDALDGQWREIVGARDVAGDLLVFLRDGRLDYLEGVIGSIDGNGVEFTRDGRTRQAPLDRIAGIVWYQPAAGEDVEAVAKLQSTSGDLLALEGVVASGEELRLRTIEGMEIGLPFDRLQDIRLGNQRITWLGELEPVTQEWQPLIVERGLLELQQKLNRPRFNKDFHGRPLQLLHPGPDGLSARRTEYARGIAVRAGTRMVFAADSEYSSLAGIAGLPTDAPPGAAIELVISGDGEVLFQQTIDDPGQGPVPLELEIAGVERLTVEVGYHDGQPIGDTLFLADLRMIR